MCSRFVETVSSRRGFMILTSNKLQGYDGGEAGGSKNLLGFLGHV
jgi:hypothetical protein